MIDDAQNKGAEARKTGSAHGSTARPASFRHEPAAPLSDVPWTLRDVARATVIFGFIFGSFAASLATIRLIEFSFAQDSARYLDGVLLLMLESALIIPVWLFTIRKYGAGWTTLGFRSFNWLSGCGLAALLLMASFALNAAWASLLSLFDLQVQPDVLPVFGGGVIGLAIAWLAAGLAAPLVEEAFFSGFLLPALLQRFGFWTAALIDGLVFAFIHFTPTAIVPLFILGVFFCLLYRATNSIWPSTLMHAIMNTLAISVAYAMETGVVPLPTTQ